MAIDDLSNIQIDTDQFSPNISPNHEDNDNKHIDYNLLTGKGTCTEPFLINNLNDFILFGNMVDNGESFSNQYIKLNCDIDFKTSSGSNLSWNPIGDINNDYYFQGIFDGNGKTISNLTVSGYDSGGLFEVLGTLNGSRATIRNLIIENANITTYTDAGILASYISNSDIENVIIKNSYISSCDVGCFSTYALNTCFSFCTFENIKGANAMYTYGYNVKNFQ